MILLQAGISAEEITAGSKLIGALLGIIIGLIIYIYKRNEAQAEERHKEQKALAEMRHKDQLELMKKLDERQSHLEKEQARLDREQVIHDFQLRALNVTINRIQGKPPDYDNAKK